MDKLKNLFASAGGIGRTRVVMFGAGALFLLALALRGTADTPKAPAPAAAPVRADTALAARADVPVYLEGLGTVQAFYTVTITPRVDGELKSLEFTEGQTVKRGDVLARIDPRPYQAALDQAIATRGKDVAQLANARRDLARYVTLAPQEFTSKQTLETQRALVAQLEAQVAGDQAAIDNARTQVDYTTIVSPIDGRTGIRMVDPGNNLHAAAGTGIVVVTQVQPISLIFTLPADALLAVNEAMALAPMTVTALSRDGKTVLDSGTVGLVDNQIDQTTGTIRLKATFPNKENRLWPGEFVNARVLVQTRRDVLTVPSAAIQRGPNGVFAYVVKPDSTIEIRPLVTGGENDSVTIVEKGLQEGERVTTSNQYRLQAGARIQLGAASGASGAPAGSKTE
jgi:membrane fusion protein, multidrug efflux system